MKNIFIFFICGAILCQPSQIGFGQLMPGPAKRENKELENEALTKKINANQVEIEKLINQLPSEKIVYIKIYVKAPPKRYAKNFISIEPTKVKAYIDSISATPVVKAKSKRTFLQRLFNNKKK